MRRLGLFLGLALAGAALAGPKVTLDLPDGRKIPGEKLRHEGTDVVLETIFGDLRVPKSLLAPPSSRGGARDGTTAEGPVVERPPDTRRETTSRWFVIESDLTDSRARLYHDQLDAFFDWMIGVYELDAKKLRKRAPFRMFVYRTRADFKRVQGEVAPGIASSKGQAFAEGVAGFFSPGLGAIYLWDTEGGRGQPGQNASHLGVAKHETTHLLNSLLSQAYAIKVPVWFQEGSATYFSAGGIGTATEPDDHPAALATVIGEIDGKKAYGNRELRSVPYATFYGREYSWGWGMIRFLRRHDDGKLWKPLLEHMRTIGGGAPSDSEDRRFLKTLRFKTSAALDEAWHAHLVAARPGDGLTPVGTSAETLAAVAAIEKPTPEQARTFARLGESFARTGQPGPAIVYLRAGFRGGVDEPELHALLALALAEGEGLAADEVWPDESIAELRLAVAGDPLRAARRLALGEQLLLRAVVKSDVRAARDMLGLALLLLAPDDDAVAIGMGALRGEAALAEADGIAFSDAVANLKLAVPSAVETLDDAYVYFLQEEGRWEELADSIEVRVKSGAATFHEREMLAGLYAAGERAEEAAVLYAALLEEAPTALRLWPQRVRALVAAGQYADARRARDAAYAAIEAAPDDVSLLRRLIERIEIP